MKPMYLIELSSGDAVYIRENDGRLHKYSLCYMTEKGVLITRHKNAGGQPYKNDPANYLDVDHKYLAEHTNPLGRPLAYSV